jgi:hypothetical protein
MKCIYVYISFVHLLMNTWDASIFWLSQIMLLECVFINTSSSSCFIVFGFITRMGNDGSYDHCAFTFLRNCHIFIVAMIFDIEEPSF